MTGPAAGSSSGHRSSTPTCSTPRRRGSARTARSSADRQKPDAEQYGWNALYRLYPTAEGWLCIAALFDTWDRLCAAVDRGDLAADARFATPEARRANDAELAATLTEVFAARTAAEWFAVLDAGDIPCEICDPDYVLRLFADPAAEDQKLVSSFRHRLMGQMKMAGLYFDLSDTPGKIGRPPLWPGQDTRTILAEIGYSDDEIDKLIATGAAEDTGQTTP